MSRNLRTLKIVVTPDCSFLLQIRFTCKRLIDIGRVLYLREKGYNARLISYTARETSLEHVALVATPSSPL